MIMGLWRSWCARSSEKAEECDSISTGPTSFSWYLRLKLMVRENS